MTAGTAPAGLSPALRRAIDQYLEEKLQERIDTMLQRALQSGQGPKKLCMIASKGTMDMAFPPLILASSAAAMGMDTAVFFTFYGLEILKKDLHLKLDPVGNPALPLPMPNLLAVLPGMRTAATAVMGRMFKAKGVAGLAELREACVAGGVRLIACQMTMEVMGHKPEQFIDGVEFGGAAAFLHEASTAQITLFI